MLTKAHRNKTDTTKEQGTTQEPKKDNEGTANGRTIVKEGTSKWRSRYNGRATTERRRDTNGTAEEQQCDDGGTTKKRRREVERHCQDDIDTTVVDNEWTP
jgi:hypothetical protein